MKLRYAAAALIGVAIAAYIVAIRPQQLRWGTTNDEPDAGLPGDDVVTSPDLVATRAITIHAATGDVWPWIAQLGQGRGGFYTYDALENLVGCDIHSADRVIPAWQAITVGDRIHLHPDVSLAVHAVPGRSLVLRGGVPMGTIPAPYDFTWAFVLLGQPDGTTRLVVRERYSYTRPWARLLVEPVTVVSFAMTQRMLRGIRDRAEQTRQARSIA